MLYDKKWDSQTKPVEPSLKGIIAWLETKDPKEEYNYCDSKNCAMSQYLKSIGQRDGRSVLLYGIGKMLNISYTSAVCFQNTKSKNFGELLNHLKRLDGQTD